MYFSTNKRVWLASRAESTKQFSGVMNQWNFSNHSVGLASETDPTPIFFWVAAIFTRASESRRADSSARPL